MATNSRWPEIQSQLLLGQDINGIPVVVCRTFHALFPALKSFLRTKFGGLAYEISVIEFQKRGLPHAHIAVKFKHELPLSAIDSLISAELPDPKENSELYTQVLTFHMHSQDHLTRPGSRCNSDGNCAYGYPQQITSNTHIDNIGRVHYRRRKGDSASGAPRLPYLCRCLFYSNNISLSFQISV
jgi:hypothetical protein